MQSERGEQATPDQSLLSKLAARGLLWEWCCNAISHPIFGYTETQEREGRCPMRLCWAEVPGTNRFVRVVLWPNGAVRTAHLDRGFRKRVKRHDPTIFVANAS